ncbi:MAG TPA: hypothetical protein VIP05_04535, partial [Burkholderiaceae bacterium]
MADARIESLDRAQAEQARLKALLESAPKAYEDRFMSSDADAPAAEATPESEQPEGFRAWLVESRLGFGDATTTGYGRQRATEFGQRLEYRRETLNYGEFVLQADGRHLGGDNATGGLGIGSLGSTTVRGVSTRIYGSGFDVRAGFGERGNLTGGPYPGFEKSQGTLGWLGATLRLDEQWFTSFQLDRARNVAAYYYDPLTAQGYGRKDITSWAASLGWGREVVRDGDFRARATLVGSRVASPTPGVATGGSHGLFVEASARTGLYRHEFGAYTARPNLYFGDYALATGTRGAYWRVDRNTSRMSWGAGLDYERAAADASFRLSGYRRFGASGNFQYIFDRYSSIGGSLSAYRTRYEGRADDSLAGTFGGAPGGSSSDGRSLYGSAFYQTRFFDWPRSRFTLTVRRNELIVLGDSAATGQEVQWEQDWIGGRYETMRPELTTTVGHARDRSGGTARSYPTAGLQF